MGPGIDLWGRSRNDSEFPLEVSLSFVEQGGSRLTMALITDITERKKAEERLLQAQKLESLGLLAGGVAHDFNNLLVGVIGNSTMALEMLPPGSAAAELLEGVVQSAQQAAHLTRQMLAYSGKGRFLLERLDLSALIPEMCGLVQPSIPKKIELNFDLSPHLPAIEADRGQVQQVFMNLVLNASEAIGSHNGVISIRTGVEEVDEPDSRLHAEAAALRPGKYVCLEVSDTGCGMDVATKAKVFDPFFTTKFTGRGLGLAAVSGIVRGHRGMIAVRAARRAREVASGYGFPPSGLRSSSHRLQTVAPLCMAPERSTWWTMSPPFERWRKGPSNVRAIPFCWRTAVWPPSRCSGNVPLRSPS